MGNFNPSLPTKYRGTNKYITFFVSRNRQPTGADYRQPETGTLYSVGTVWQVAKDPTTGTEGELWMLSKIVANVAYWILVNGAPGAATEFAVQTGISPVVPDGGGLVTFDGLVVNAGTNPVRTDGTGANTMALEVQISQAIPASNATNIGLSAFDSSHFSVDVNGFVSLLGGGQAVDSFQVDTFTAPGTNPVLPTVGGLVTITGGQIAAGTTANVIRTNSLANNTYTIEVQRSKTEAATTVGSNGVSHFSDDYFSVDGNAFVQIKNAFQSWTPTMSGGTNPGVTTYSVQSGFYYRVGNLAIAQFDLAWTASTATGDIIITGFPSNFEGAQSRAPLGTIWVEGMVWPVNVTYFVAHGEDATSLMRIYGMADNTSPPDQLQCANTGTLHGTIVYYTFV